MSNFSNTLEFTQTGEFTILQLTDLHYSSNQQFNDLTTSLQQKLLDSVKPNLVAFTGDSIWCFDSKNLTKNYYYDYYNQFTKPCRDRQINYAYVLGNHEYELGLSAKEMCLFDQQNYLSVMREIDCYDPDGYSNYLVFLTKNKRLEFLLWFFDTHNVREMETEYSYNTINQEQINWYIKKSQIINQLSSQIVQGIAFMHIPLRQYMYMYNNTETFGNHGEMVCGPKYETGAFDHFVKQKNIQEIYCGHDHDNDYSGIYQNIGLFYGRKGGYDAYHNLPLGGRVIKLKIKEEENNVNNKVNVENYIVTEEGKEVQDKIRRHLPSFCQQKECVFEDVRYKVQKKSE